MPRTARNDAESAVAQRILERMPRHIGMSTQTVTDNVLHGEVLRGRVREVLKAMEVEGMVARPRKRTEWERV